MLGRRLAALPRNMRAEIYKSINNLPTLRALSSDSAARNRRRSVVKSHVRQRLRDVSYNPRGNRMPGNPAKWTLDESPRALEAAWAARLLPSMLLANRIMRGAPAVRPRMSGITVHTHDDRVYIIDETRRTRVELTRENQGQYLFGQIEVEIAVPRKQLKWGHGKIFVDRARISVGYYPHADLAVGYGTKDREWLTEDYLTTVSPYHECLIQAANLATKRVMDIIRNNKK